MRFEKRYLVGLVVGLFLGLAAPLHAADLTITAANVKQVSGTPQQYTAAATITAGQLVYLDSVTAQAKLAKADSTTTAAAVGVALNNASSGQPIIVLTNGVITIGATTVKGTIYVMSAANAGGIAPWADLVSTNQLTLVGYANSATQITLTINATAIALP